MTHLKVAVRIRPLSAREITLQSPSILCLESNEKTIAITNVKVPEQNAGDSRERIRRFTFDLCFHENSTQDNVFQAVESVIGKAIKSRCHSCVLAYGQSSTGKTHTMMGFPHDPGLIPRLCLKLFSYLEETFVAEEMQQQPPKITVSYLEIYNEKVRDLLLSNNNNSSSKLKVRQHPQRGPYVQGLTEHCITDSSSLLQILEQGTQKRRVASTSTNLQSSRSHSVFVVNFGGVKLTLVDLAGSERAGNRCYSTSRFREGANINKSLVALGNVISALAEDSLKWAKGARRRFIPYRDSVLTWLLKDTLGGNSDTVLIATVSPSSACYTETVNTLRFGQRAKLIVSIPVVNEDPKEKTIRLLRAEIARLRELLKIGPLDNPPGLEAMADENSGSTTPTPSKQPEKPSTFKNRLQRTFSVASVVKNKDGSAKKFNSEEAISSRNKKPPSVPALTSTSSSRKGSIDRTLKSLTNAVKKSEKSVATDSKIEPKTSDLIRRGSLLKPGRSQIVAAVTHRLYAKTKKKEVGTDTSDIEPAAADIPKELMICSNARLKLKELTKRALKAHRSKNEETQTDMFPVLRVKEVATDSEDLLVVLNEMKNAETSTDELEMIDKEVECTLLSCFSDEMAKEAANLAVTRTCGTQSDQNNTPTISFTRYLSDLESLSNPIFTQAVNINISHNYINGQKASNSSVSDDSLEDNSHLCFPTPDLISNHNSLEPHAAHEASTSTANKVRQAHCMEETHLFEQAANFIPEEKPIFSTAQCNIYSPPLEKISAIYIPSVCAPQSVVNNCVECVCEGFEVIVPERAKAKLIDYETLIGDNDSVTLLEPLVLKSIMKHCNDEDNNISDTELPDSLEYHQANNNKKVRFAERNKTMENDRMLKAMSEFLEEATILMNNLTQASSTAPQTFDTNDYEVQVTVNNVSGVDEYQNWKRKRKSDAKCQTDDKHTKSNYVQTIISSNGNNATTVNSSTQFYDFDVPANKYELLLEDSCRRLEHKLQWGEQELMDMNHGADLWGHQTDSLDSSANARTFSDYGSLPRRRTRKKSPSCSPSAFLRQLTSMRQQVVDATREELFNGSVNDD